MTCTDHGPTHRVPPDSATRTSARSRLIAMRGPLNDRPEEALRGAVNEAFLAPGRLEVRPVSMQDDPQVTERRCGFGPSGIAGRFLAINADTRVQLANRASWTARH